MSLVLFSGLDAYKPDPDPIQVVLICFLFLLLLKRVHDL